MGFPLPSFRDAAARPAQLASSQTQCHLPPSNLCSLQEAFTSERLLSFLLEIPSGIQAVELFPRLLEHQDLLISHFCVLVNGEFSSTHFLCFVFSF